MKKDPPSLSEDGFYGLLLTLLVLIYLNPSPSEWSSLLFYSVLTLSFLVVYLYLSWVHRMRQFRSLSQKFSDSPRLRSSSSSSIIEGYDGSFPSSSPSQSPTPSCASSSTTTLQKQIQDRCCASSTTPTQYQEVRVPVADAVLGVPPYGSRLTAPNIRDDLISQTGPGCVKPPINGSASVLKPAQFFRADPVPKIGPNYYDPQLVPPSDNYRDMQHYTNPEFVLQQANNPKTWVGSNPNTLNSNLQPIPASQPYFYCDLYNRATGEKKMDSYQSGEDRCGFQPLGDSYISINQKLAGGANPKTLIPPRIPTRLFDYQEWAEDPYVTLPGINAQYDQELYQSGYIVTDCIPTGPSYYRKPQMSESTSCYQNPVSSNRDETKENYAPPPPKSYPKSSPSAPSGGVVPKSKIPIGMIENENPSTTMLRQQQHNQEWVIENTMDTSQGYHPQNLQYNEYVNSPYDPSWDKRCQNQKNNYNREIGTIPIQPGMSTYSQVNQPDAMMSNMGISFTQPFLPTIPQQNRETGELQYTEYDPLSVPEGLLDNNAAGNYSDNDHNGEVSRINIYDPRLTGYGTSYRGYVDEMTGQPRFYYDDIEATTQYNYITRNHIDFTPYGTSVGPAIEGNVTEWPSAMDVRQQANDQFANSVLFQRADLQERLMRKNTHREKQRRMAPFAGKQKT